MAKRHGEFFKDNFFSSMIAKPADNKRTATLEPFPNRLSRSVYSLKDNKSGCLAEYTANLLIVVNKIPLVKAKPNKL